MSMESPAAGNCAQKASGHLAKFKLIGRLGMNKNHNYSL